MEYLKEIYTALQTLEKNLFWKSDSRIRRSSFKQILYCTCEKECINLLRLLGKRIKLIYNE